MTRQTKPPSKPRESDADLTYDIALAEWRAKYGALAEALYKPPTAPESK